MKTDGLVGFGSPRMSAPTSPSSMGSVTTTRLAGAVAVALSA